MCTNENKEKDAGFAKRKASSELHPGCQDCGRCREIQMQSQQGIKMAAGNSIIAEKMKKIRITEQAPGKANFRWQVRKIALRRCCQLHEAESCAWPGRGS